MFEVGRGDSCIHVCKVSGIGFCMVNRVECYSICRHGRVAIGPGYRVTNRQQIGNELYCGSILSFFKAIFPKFTS